MKKPNLSHDGIFRFSKWAYMGVVIVAAFALVVGFIDWKRKSDQLGKLNDQALLLAQQSKQLSKDNKFLIARLQILERTKRADFCATTTIIVGILEAELTLLHEKNPQGPPSATHKYVEEVYRGYKDTLQQLATCED